jgi:hypothetical protein
MADTTYCGAPFYSAKNLLVRRPSKASTLFLLYSLENLLFQCFNNYHNDCKKEPEITNKAIIPKISGHQQSWRYEDGPWKGPGPPLLVAADLSQFMSRRYRSGLHPSSMPRGNGRTF